MTRAISFNGIIARQSDAQRTVVEAILDVDPHADRTDSTTWIVNSEPLTDDRVLYVAHCIRTTWTGTAFSADALATTIRSESQTPHVWNKRR